MKLRKHGTNSTHQDKSSDSNGSWEQECEDKKNCTGFLPHLRRTLKGWFGSFGRKKKRDTILCDEDYLLRSEQLVSSYSIRGFDFDQELLSISGSSSIHDSNRYESVSNRVPDDFCSSKLRRSGPSQEQRWCRNCGKCFQRTLSRFDGFCGLDCKTAYRFRSCVQDPLEGHGISSAHILQLNRFVCKNL
ncbi:unnamed protein product [Albugo candida]|uniref:Uncharacterized protein n=1 Tax=Albugo candida TaxID=65357 RepID=A0A024GB06_9STRA|nr:unnamed protein product [Albugo candida]|eukprot:CCI43507.1 unnamed protein product [Albugo candida]